MNVIFAMPVTVSLSCHVMSWHLSCSVHVMFVLCLFFGEGHVCHGFCLACFSSAGAFLVLSRTILSILSHASGAGPLSKC